MAAVVTDTETPLLTWFTIGNDLDVVLGRDHDGQHEQGHDDVRRGNHVPDDGHQHQQAGNERTEQTRPGSSQLQGAAGPVAQLFLKQGRNLQPEVGVLAGPEHGQRRAEEKP